MDSLTMIQEKRRKKQLISEEGGKRFLIAIKASPPMAEGKRPSSFFFSHLAETEAALSEGWTPALICKELETGAGVEIDEAQFRAILSRARADAKAKTIAPVPKPTGSENANAIKSAAVTARPKKKSKPPVDAVARKRAGKSEPASTVPAQSEPGVKATTKAMPPPVLVPGSFDPDAS